jgi:hypothetical protein
MQSKGQRARSIRVSYHNGDHYNRQAMADCVDFSMVACSGLCQASRHVTTHVSLVAFSESTQVRDCYLLWHMQCAFGR